MITKKIWMHFNAQFVAYGVQTKVVIIKTVLQISNLTLNIDKKNSIIDLN